MILILSNSHDKSTTNVIEWLEFLGKKWIRINAEEAIEIDFIGQDISFKLENESFLLSQITSFWYRRGLLNIRINLSEIQQFRALQQSELAKFVDYIFYRLSTLKYLNLQKNADVNKLVVSSIAKKLGISTPEDYICSDLKTVQNIHSISEKNYISKPVSGDSIQPFTDFTIFNYTELVNPEMVYPVRFFPSLLQNCIAKKYELRSFYLNGSFFTMAIFSQKDQQTTIDFRNYNKTKPNRTVPYQLPEAIASKLNLLMQKLELNSGSIDIIVTPAMEYIFLEVNPIGQFGMTSYPCNYNLERKIAEYL